MTALPFDAVYLARHGQTEWNLEGRLQGRLDSPLTPLGVLQARRNGELLRREPIDGVYASPLGRARTTAGVLAAALGLRVEVVDELAEVDHGEWAGLTRGEVQAARPEQALARRRDKYRYRFPGGESYAEADARAGRALARVERSGARVPLLVSHEMIGRMLLRNLAGLTAEQALRGSQPWDVVHRVTPAAGSVEAMSPPGDESSVR